MQKQEAKFTKSQSQKTAKFSVKISLFFPLKNKLNYAVFHKHFEQKKIMVKILRSAVMSIIVYIIFPSKNRGKK